MSAPVSSRLSEVSPQRSLGVRYRGGGLRRRRSRSWKRTFADVLSSLQTLRFEPIHQPERLVWPAGRLVLRFAVSAGVRRRIRASERCLQKAA